MSREYYGEPVDVEAKILNHEYKERQWEEKEREHEEADDFAAKNDALVEDKKLAEERKLSLEKDLESSE